MPGYKVKRKIGFFATHAGYGGTEEGINKLIPPAAQRGHPIVFFHHATSRREWVERMSRHACAVQCEDGPPHEEVPGEPVEAALQATASRGLVRSACRLLIPRSLRFALYVVKEAWRLRRVLKGNPVGVLHFSDLSCDPQQVLAAKMAGVPRLTGTISCLPDADQVRSGSPYRLIETLCFACMDDIIVVSKRGRELWLRRARLNPRKVRVVYNGIDAPPLERVRETSAEVRRELGIPPDARVIGVSARLAPIKGHAFLLEAFPRILEAAPGAWLMFAGDGPSRAQLEEHARRLGISQRVAFLGTRSDIMRIVQAYDIVALPSVTESFPFSLLEGMACAKPVVASAVGGIPELVEHGGTGWLVPPGDAGALAQAIGVLLAHPAEAERMGKAGRERVLREFTLERMIRQSLDVILGGAPDGRAAEAAAGGSHAIA